MALQQLLAVVLLLFTGSVFGCQPPDCDRPDCGTCGNACCQLQFIFSISKTEDVYDMFVNNLKKGGADMRYTFKGGFDLRSYNFTDDFIIQGWHTTLTHHYNDTLDFTVKSIPTNLTIVTAFSISQIAGAYCDSGQNFKNLIGFVKGFAIPFGYETIRGCPAPPRV